eukprot:5206255-Amphidinium_carterae.1
MHDASFAGEQGLNSQRGAMTFLTVYPSQEGGTRGHLLSWESATIKRVVKSTLAAEACAASIGLDRLCYTSTAWASLLGIEGTWSEKLTKLEPGELCTDCKSLHDHLKTTSNGSLQEKRVLLDIADIRQNVDEGKVGISWIPTACMLADCLTKYVANPQSLFLFLEFNIMVVNGLELSEDGMEHLCKMQPASSA